MQVQILPCLRNSTTLNSKKVIQNKKQNFIIDIKYENGLKG